MRGEPFVYRPIGNNPMFTTESSFPRPSCGDGDTDADACASGARLHNRMREAYDELLRLGIPD